jgi:hypothetical protein
MKSRKVNFDAIAVFTYLYEKAEDIPTTTLDVWLWTPKLGFTRTQAGILISENSIVA